MKITFSYPAIQSEDYVFLPRAKSKEDALYELPEKLKVKSQLKQSEEMLSNQMLSGIPEVNLGIQAKIRNIEATEEAKMKMIEERKSRKNQGPSIMVPTNVAVDFMQHNRCKLYRLTECMNKKGPIIKLPYNFALI